MFHRLAILAAVAALISVQLVHAAEPAVKCETSKLKASGKYASCLLGADAKALRKNTIPDYLKCDEKISKSWSKAETKGAGMCPAGAGDGVGIQAFIDACDQAVAGALAGGGLPSDVATCNADLTTCLARPIAQVLKTGQTVCSNSAGTVIPCLGTGQDGEFEFGVAHSFTDNGDGTITDNVTGLMWEKLSDDGTTHDKDNTYTWTNAFGKIDSLNGHCCPPGVICKICPLFAGYGDWRLPNRNELLTLVNSGTTNPAVFPEFDTDCTPSCNGLTCSCTASGQYWSSTPYAGNSGEAWRLLFTQGGMDHNPKTNSFNVRAVRGGLCELCGGGK